MGKTYNSESARRIGSADKLKFIKDYYDERENIKVRGSSTLSNLYDENYDDTVLRTVCLESAAQIRDAYEEGNYLIGMDIDTSNPGYNWIGVSSYYLTGYAPEVSEIRGLDNTKYTYPLKDLCGIWNMFKKYSSDRSEEMVVWAALKVFDDNYARVRQITKYNQKYEVVMKDADLGGGLFRGYSLRKQYEIVVKDTEFKQWNTKPEPILPTIAEFRGLVSMNSSNSSVVGFCSLLESMVDNVNSSEPSWGDKLRISSNAYPNRYAEAIAENLTEEEADKLIAELPEYLTFEDGYLFINGKFISVKKEIQTPGDIKDPYLNNFNTATPNIKSAIYNYYPDIYKNNIYKVTVKVFVDQRVNYVEDNSANATIPYKRRVSDAGIQNAITELYRKMTGAYGVYNGAEPNTRCETGEPAIFYNDKINKIKSFVSNSGASGEMLLRIKTLCNEIKAWAKTRGKDLYAQTTDDNNAGKFIEALRKRLDKNTGTIMRWYQSLISIDSEYRKVQNSSGMTKYVLTDMLVSKVVNTDDQNLFLNQNCPRFIDIEVPDSMYDELGYYFKKGDTIYIIDDIHSEVVSKIVNIETISVTSTDYSNVSLEDYNGGKMNGAMTKYKNAYRITLDKALPVYYSNGNDVSSLRVMKII